MLRPVPSAPSAARALAAAAAALIAALAGCQPAEEDDDTSPAPDDDATDDDDATADDDTTPEGCVGTAEGSFPAGAVEIAYDNGSADSDITLYEGYAFEGYYGTYDLAEEPQWEAVRFELAAPATVYGARVQWTNLRGDEPVEVPVGAYPDFGSNGFDFEAWAPLWEGTRCLSRADEGSWSDYVFDAPIEVERPGLFFIAHFKQDVEEDPLWLFDDDYLGSGDCAAFADCHSAWNYPGADDEVYYNGISSPMPYDYAVRLLVEVHDTIPAEDKWFQVDPALNAGGRVAWGDYDDDGDDDLMTDGPTLYRNDGGEFTNVTGAAWPAGLAGGWSGGGAWADYDDDGCLDYFGFNNSYVGIDVLLHNECDGTFTDRILDSGIDDTQSEVGCDDAAEVEQAPTEGIGWVDIDQDGWIDLYVGNHNCWTTYTFYQDRIWRNRGDGTFEEWGLEHGFTTSNLPTRGVSPVDADRDGDVDILTSNYVLSRNLYYENHGDGQFTEIAQDNGLAGIGDQYSLLVYYYGHTIGAAWLDAENDGDWDVFQANLAHPRYYDFSDKSMWMINDGGGLYADTRVEAGIAYRETHSSPTALDFDLDGFTDLFVTCVYDGRDSELYRNRGDGTFQQVNYESGAVVKNGWGSAYSDYDNDGDPDLVAYQLLRNDTAAAGNHFLKVAPRRGAPGGHSNRPAIGAQVEVEAGGTVRLLQVDGSHGTGCQDSQVLVFGLGSAASADRVSVSYPGGARVDLPGPLAIDRRIDVYQDGSVVER